jgi:hypothetical protein
MAKNGSDKGIIIGIIGLFTFVLGALPGIFTGSRRMVKDQENE